MDAEYFNLLLKLCFILVLMITAAYFLKRSKLGFRFTNKHIQLNGQFSLGSKEKIVLVEVNNKQLLLGVTAAQIRTLYVFDQDNPAQSSRDFSEVLKGTIA